MRGDPEAVNQVLDHYSGYIAALSMRRGYDQNGNPCLAVDEEIRAVKQAKAQRGERVNGEVPYGYIIDPENKNHLLPDPETAHVVRQIFAMYIRGDRICEIQDWLRENKVLTVSGLRYRRTGSCRHTHPHPGCIYNWPDKTLYDILARKEYLGHTVTAKSYKVSYKSKKTRRNPEDKQHFFPNTHEALIDEETFDLAQKRIATKHRPAKREEIDLFSGLLFCGDCGYKMYLQQGAGTLERKHGYTCGRYRNRIRTGEVCTTHYIRKSVLKELVLGDIQRVLSYVKAHDQQFTLMVSGYDDEKAALVYRIRGLEKELSAVTERRDDVSRFVQIVRKYTDVQELSYEIVHEFIDRIFVYKLDKDTNTRKVEIYYSFVGQVDTGGGTHGKRFLLPQDLRRCEKLCRISKKPRQIAYPILPQQSSCRNSRHHRSAGYFSAHADGHILQDISFGSGWSSILQPVHHLWINAHTEL